MPRVYTKKPIEESFKDKYIPEPNTGCWLWIGTTNDSGYGIIKRFYRAHRVSYELNVGPVPDGMFVCHKCDTPTCVNPKHLFLGAPKDNVIDMHRKNRARKSFGSDHFKSVMNDQTVIEAVNLWNSGKNCSAVGRAFGVHDSTIRNIILRNHWTHVTHGVFIRERPPHKRRL